MPPRAPPGSSFLQMLLRLASCSPYHSFFGLPSCVSYLYHRPEQVSTVFIVTIAEARSKLCNPLALWRVTCVGECGTHARRVGEIAQQ